MTKISRMTGLLGAAAVALGLAAPAAAEETLRLEWVIQGQFAGPIVAADKGWYEEAGVDLELVPAGPDIKPAVTVATGADSFGIGHPNQIIAARSNGVPLVQVLQLGQRSATTYIARADAGISQVADMPGNSVGLWFGGDEHEFLAMLNAAGVDQGDVDIVSQGYDIVSWLNGEYDVMQVTLYNELQQVYRNGYAPDDLVFLDPADYGVALISTGVFTTERMIEEEPETVQAVVDATLRGWQWALENPEAAAEIVVAKNSELEVANQVTQIEAMGEMFCDGPTLEGKFGMSEMADFEVSQTVLLDAGLIDAPIDLSEAFTNAFWEKAPSEYKTLPCEG